jgi:serine phosphatase RsbU (regulator of sigma subunit)
VAAFDFFRVDDPAALWERPSALPMEAYVWMLAQRGQLALADALDFENQQLRRAFNLVMQSERREVETAALLERKMAELETANRLLKQRTRELVSLEGIGQALITWNDLRDLGTHVLKAAMELSKADRGSLYYVRSAEWGQIIASQGWGETHNEMGLARSLIYEKLSDREAMDYLEAPPGIDPAPDSPRLRAGLSLPLVAHGIPAGLMLIQSTRKSRFSQGEAAILSTLAGYAAVAMQRAGLIEQLQGKIDALEAANVELAQKERLDRELELARQVQLSMLPHTFPILEGVEFAASYAPAYQVGGDFYDVIRLDEDHVALVIADVSDKGMPAALYMALTRSLILSAAQQYLSPADVLHNVNQLLREIGEQDMFVTVFYGVLNRANGRLTYARAGHDHPFLLRDGHIEQLDGPGMALGLFDPPVFSLAEQTIEVRSGDRLVLYTDGLTDVNGPDGVMLGRERLVDCLLDYADRPPGRMCRDLFDYLDSYRQGEPQFDDMALVVAALT